MDRHITAQQAFEQMSRPLLELLQHQTGLENTFLTAIDWEALSQEVVLSLNTTDVIVPEGARVDWKDSMCRLAFEAGKAVSCDVASDFPGSLGALALRMQTFFALPIQLGEEVLGTVCGASRRSVEVPQAGLRAARLIGDALALQLQAVKHAHGLRLRAEKAEEAVRELRGDLTEARQRALHLHTLACTDELTGVCNRRAFLFHWDEACKAAAQGSNIALMLVDLDKFKAINDGYGHLIGDKVLKAAAAAMQHGTRRHDVVARLGGDEFAIIVAGCDRSGYLVELGHRIQQSFKQACASFGVRASFSIGAASSHDCKAEALFECADDALYQGKEVSGGGVVLWSNSPRSQPS
ncbi:GGDEF domain-containing protein [Azohydromonas aeria]|uniref:GGDEF domain-containing protein n=1 Tax=Azohydromonas aeria TaxID=2590212 RepID=UPI0012FB8543|nr:GGDEF domain-containing protein [Azohydromonas aeria]